MPHLFHNPVFCFAMVACSLVGWSWFRRVVVLRVIYMAAAVAWLGLFLLAVA